MEEPVEADLQKLVSETATCLRGGGVILYPTETVYGLGCDPFRDSAVRRIQVLKGREAAKPMLVLTDEWNRVADWLDDLFPTHRRIMEMSPRLPLTVLFRASALVPVSFRGDSPEVGIRCTSNLFCSQVIAEAGFPILSTSANPAGQSPPSEFQSVHESIRNNVDLAVDAGHKLAGLASTVVRAHRDSIEVVREGAVTGTEIERLLETPVNR